MWFLFDFIFIIVRLIEDAWMCSVWYDQFKTNNTTLYALTGKRSNMCFWVNDCVIVRLVSSFG
jgi:hypothetical protein